MKTPARLLVLMWFASLSFVACTESSLSRDAHPPTLNGTVWRVVTINGRAPVARSEPTMAFAEAQVAGSAGCNSYSGNYRYDPATGSIAFDQAAMTAMACLEQARMDVEATFATAMTAATSASIDPQGRLVLAGPGGEIVLAVDAVGS
jgi:heat shock protein HslJ